MRTRVAVAVAVALVSLLLSGLARAEVDDPLWRAVEHFRTGHFEDARQGFEAIRDREPSVDYGAYLGPTYYKLGRFEEARAALAPAFRRGDQDPVATYYLALTYYRLGFTGLARRAFADVQRGNAGPKLAAGSQRFLEQLNASAASLGASPILAFAVQLDSVAPDLALDYALEASLRATTVDEQAQARALLGRFTKGRFGDIRSFVDRLANGGAIDSSEGGGGGSMRSAPRQFLSELADLI